MKQETEPSETAETQKFENVFREHATLVYRTAYGVTGSHQEAEDVLQPIFLRLIGREFPPDLRKNPKAYLYRAAVNVSLDAVRRKRRYVLVESSELRDVPVPIPNSSDLGAATERETVEIALSLVSFRRELSSGVRALRGLRLSRID